MPFLTQPFEPFGFSIFTESSTSSHMPKEIVTCDRAPCRLQEWCVGIPACWQ